MYIPLWESIFSHPSSQKANGSWFLRAMEEGVGAGCLSWLGQPQLDPKFPHPHRDESTPQQGSLEVWRLCTSIIPATASPGAPATSRVPAGPHPVRVPTSLVLIGGYMQTPVVSSFMGRESGGEPREWAQRGLLAGSACSQERRRDREEEAVRREEREETGEGKERKTAQCKTDPATQTPLQPASPWLLSRRP